MGGCAPLCPRPTDHAGGPLVGRPGPLRRHGFPDIASLGPIPHGQEAHTAFVSQRGKSPSRQDLLGGGTAAEAASTVQRRAGSICIHRPCSLAYRLGAEM